MGAEAMGWAEIVEKLAKEELFCPTDRVLTDEHYGRLAAVEDKHWYFDALHTQVTRELQRVYPKGTKMLDAGCGTGGFLRRLVSRDPRWEGWGVDHSPTAVDWAEKRTSCRISCAPLEQLPFPDGTFSAVVCADVLYQVEDPQKVLRELGRVLRPRGLLVVTAPAYGWLRSYHDEAVGGRRRYTRAELAATLAGGGFKPHYLSHWNMFLLPAIAAKRRMGGSGDDVRPAAAPVEWVARTCGWVENRAQAWGIPLPFGASLVAGARKQ